MIMRVLVTTWLIFVMSLAIVEGDFCEKKPYTFICARESQCALEPECGETSQEEIGFGPEEASMRTKIVKDINELRRSLAEGKVSSKGKTFPPAGDMVLIEWNYDLERAAQNYARLCSYENSKPERRIHENMTEISEYVGMVYNSGKISGIQFWEDNLNTWNGNELAKMEPYISSNKKLDGKDILILYGKQRYVGCGWLLFFEEEKKFWTRYITCHFATAGLQNNMFYAKNKKACTACPLHTDCAKRGTHKGILCSWSGGMSTFLLRPLLAFITSMAVVIVSQF